MKSEIPYKTPEKPPRATAYAIIFRLFSYFCWFFAVLAAGCVLMVVFGQVDVVRHHPYIKSVEDWLWALGFHGFFTALFAFLGRAAWRASKSKAS